MFNISYGYGDQRIGVHCTVPYFEHKWSCGWGPICSSFYIPTKISHTALHHKYSPALVISKLFIGYSLLAK